ncbi:ATP-dependent metallopeptidase FtsH/Yme1/Tma family protein, partial [Methylomicrobium sp. RS1]|uniref:ATP-dependent metallopeptidase FtsH/Yme1/Tma family protein n=1 Tax=Candidatus Methylomicrobium oryzae TaxID=2802053 RepID=UPI001921C367|nr:ATP-dependent metallopeptidase FtsH/Yme1/Tma family protein [Methylomicrobium sp. RS1]
MKSNLYNLLFWSILITGLILVFNRFSAPPPAMDGIAYSDFLAKVKAKQVTRV